jgi:hypothetical protein
MIWERVVSFGAYLNELLEHPDLREEALLVVEIVRDKVIDELDKLPRAVRERQCSKQDLAARGECSHVVAKRRE